VVPGQIWCSSLDCVKRMIVFLVCKKDIAFAMEAVLSFSNSYTLIKKDSLGKEEIL